VLVEQHGRIVGKEEFMERLWPDSFVEESNLIFNVQQLRKALGDNAKNPVYVETVARRGYRFIAEVEECLTGETQTSTPKSFKPHLAFATSILLIVSITTWYFVHAKRVQSRSVSAGATAGTPPALKVMKLTDTGKNRHAVISPDGQYVAYTFETKGQHSI